jgi:hypothetical protein
MKCPKCLVSTEYMDLRTGNRNTVAEWLNV